MPRSRADLKKKSTVNHTIPGTRYHTSIRKLSGLKLAIFRLFCLVLASSKPPTPIHIGLFTPLICADLRGVKNPREIGGNPPIGGPEQCLHTQSSRIFQGSSKIAIDIQGLFKNFKDLSEIQGFQGFFQGCGHPELDYSGVV